MKFVAKFIAPAALILLTTGRLELGAQVLANEPRHAFGYANSSCGTFTSERRLQSATGDKMVVWTLGFLTGLNFSSLDRDLLVSVDINAVVAWMDNYCREHPLKNLNQAAYGLLDELKK